MITIDGLLYDGLSSKPINTQLVCNEHGQVFPANNTALLADINKLDISPRIGNSARYIQLSNTQRFETRDNDGVDLLCQQWLPENANLVHKLESSLKWVSVSVIALVAITYLFIAFGIPALSKQIAFWLPYSVDQQLAQHTLKQLDQQVFKPSKISIEQQQLIHSNFADLIADKESPPVYTLEFRHGNKLGANAFALPDGTIIVTDELVALAHKEEMLTGVLLHEIAHIKYRHSLQNLVRQAGLSMLIVSITGDVNTASTIVLMLPNLIMQAQYSQEFEWESDSYALSEMQKRQLDTEHFANMLSAMQKTRGDKDEGSTLNEYLASHPATSKRISRFMKSSPSNNEP